MDNIKTRTEAREIFDILKTSSYIGKRENLPTNNKIWEMFVPGRSQRVTSIMNEIVDNIKQWHTQLS